MQDDNVIPIAPGVNPQTERLEEPYSTPARAVAAVLRKGNFDKAVTNIGPVEIRMIAEFTDRGAAFHAIAVVPMAPQNPLAKAVSEPEPANPLMMPTQKSDLSVDAPAVTILQMLAEVYHQPRSFFTLRATVGEMEALDRELKGHSVETLRTLSRFKVDPGTAERTATSIMGGATLAILRSLAFAWEKECGA